MDSGVENLNGTVDELFDSTALRRVIAQFDVSFSNSLIEAWWRVLKHHAALHGGGDMKTPKDIGASVRARLLRLACERGEDFQLVLTRYAKRTLSISSRGQASLTAQLTTSTFGSLAIRVLNRSA